MSLPGEYTPICWNVTFLGGVGASPSDLAFLVEGQTFIRGDANADGAFNIADPILTLGFLFNMDPILCELALDANDDEGSDISDAIYLLDHLFRAQSPPPPAPFPGCGLNESPDGVLTCGGSTGCP